MTHSLNGNIIASPGLISLDYAKLNLHETVREFMRKNHKRYGSVYSKGLTTYYALTRDSPHELDESSQPFILVFDSPKKLSYVGGDLRSARKSGFNLNKRRDSLLLKIESGCHVGFSNKEEAREILDASRLLHLHVYSSIKEASINSEICLLFDDEKDFYSRSGFVERIGSKNK